MTEQNVEKPKTMDDYINEAMIDDTTKFSSGFFRVILSSKFLITLNLILLLASFIFSLKFSNFAIFAGSGAILSVSGILLSIKHNLLVESSDLSKAISSKMGIGAMDTADRGAKVLQAHETLKIIKDEQLGVILTIIGAFIGGYGGLLSKAMFCS